MAELESLKKKQLVASSSTVTPTRKKLPAPSPTTVSRSGTKASKPDVAPQEEQPGTGHEEGEESANEEVDPEVEPESVEPGFLSEAAKNNRLRRVCEKKPSGRCHVSSEIHDRWLQGGSVRLALRDQLEACDWDKDC